MNLDEINIRKLISEEVNKVLTNFLSKNPEEPIRDYYVGKVVTNNDPDKLGRCQIRVYGVFENNIQDSDLPWAMPEFSFVGSNKGSFIVPTVGTIVRVYFDKGDIYLPIYTNKIVDKTNLPSDINTNYPDTMVFFETDAGDKFTINRNTGDTIFTHKSGSLIKIDGTGNITIEGTQQVTINHANILTVAGSNVIPNSSGKGPLCAIPFDPITGLPHVGNICAP